MSLMSTSRRWSGDDDRPRASEIVHGRRVQRLERKAHRTGEVLLDEDRVRKHVISRLLDYSSRVLSTSIRSTRPCVPMRPFFQNELRATSSHVSVQIELGFNRMSGL